MHFKQQGTLIWNTIEDLYTYKERQHQKLENHYNYLKSLDLDDEPTIMFCKGLLQLEANKLDEDKRTYKLGKVIDPRGDEVHITEDFANLIESPEISNSTKFHAQLALTALNSYKRYLNKYSIEPNKYPKHRRDIHKLNPDIELPNTAKEIFKHLEDATKEKDPDGYKLFLNALGQKRSQKRNPLEKLIKKLSDPKYIKDRPKKH